MSETKLIRDHHLLTRNMKLNDNYVSNDGGNEGIGITDAGNVSLISYPTGALTYEVANTEYVQCGNVTELNSVTVFSVSSWSYHTEESQDFIWDKHVDTNNKVFLWANSGDMMVYITTGGSSAYVASVLHEDNEWEHWVVVFDGSETGNDRLKLYRNGEYLDNSDAAHSVYYSAQAMPAATPDLGSNQFYIGRGDGGYMEGKIGEVAFWDAALTAPNVTKLYDNGHPYQAGLVNSTDLIGYWKFEEGTGTSVVNTANPGTYNGTLVNTPTWSTGPYASSLKTTSSGVDILRGDLDSGVSNITSGGLLKLDVDADADDRTGDSATGRLTIGAGEDLNLYHGGTNSYIVNDTGKLIIDSTSDIDLDADGGEIYLKDGGTTFGKFSTAGSYSSLTLYEDGGATADDYLDIRVSTNGETFIRTVDANAAVAHLDVEVDGNFEVDAVGDIILDAAGNVGIGNTAPGAMLEVTARAASSEATRPSIEISSFSDANILNTSAGVLKFHKSHNDSGNSYGAGAHTVANEVIGRIEAWGVNNPSADADEPILASYIEFAGGSIDATANAPAGKIQFATCIGTGDPLIRMTITDTNKINIKDGGQLYFDADTDGVEGNTYISHASDILKVTVGGDLLMSLEEKGTDGNYVFFKTSCAGFTQSTTVFDATDTVVDFRHTNKSILTLTADITDVHFQFPSISGNFLCVFLQDGTGGWDVTNWKTKDAAGNAGNGNSGVVKFAGGTATSLTETADRADIISIYWDATNEMAYAVASENF